MAARDLERLLRDAAKAPLGPMSLQCGDLGGGAWRVVVTWAGREPVEIGAGYDTGSDVVRLERQVEAQASLGHVEAVTAALPWVMEAAPIAGGGVAARLWLRVEGLSANALLGALSVLTRLGAAYQESPAALPATTAARPPATVAPPQPEPVVDLDRPPSWQSLATQPIAAEPPPEPVASLSEVMAAPATVGRNCGQCGAPHPPDHTFCVSCGARLDL